MLYDCAIKNKKGTLRRTRLDLKPNICASEIFMNLNKYLKKLR